MTRYRIRRIKSSERRDWMLSSSWLVEKLEWNAQLVVGTKSKAVRDLRELRKAGRRKP